MALLGNKTLHNKSPVYLMGGSIGGTKANWKSSGKAMGRFFGAFSAIFGAYPCGYAPGSAWKLALKVNAISSFIRTIGEGTATLLIIPPSFLSAGSGDATIALAGSASLGGSSIDNIGTCACALGALSGLTGSAEGISNASLDSKAYGFFFGTASTFADLSPETIAQAVWSANAASVDIVGTTGAKINDVGTSVSGGLTTEEHDMLVATAKKPDIAPLY